MRTLHALGRAQAPSLLLLELLGEVAPGSGEGQSPAGPGPVSLCRRNRSRCEETNREVKGNRVNFTFQAAQIFSEMVQIARI